jgi:thioesterase domain-containing protein
VIPTFEQLGKSCGDTLHAHIGSSPCIVAGYSFSGKVAFEAAHAMRRAGTPVALVLLIDAYAWTGATRVTASRIWSSIWQSFSTEKEEGSSYVKRLLVAVKRSSQLFWWLILQMPSVAKPRVIRNKSHPTSLVDSKGIPIDEFALRRLNRRAGRTYRPAPLDTRGVLIRAHLPHETVLPQIDITNGWGNLFLQGLKLVQVSGDHLSIIRNDQNATELAQQITSLLNCFDFSHGRVSKTGDDASSSLVAN